MGLTALNDSQVSSITIQSPDPAALTSEYVHKLRNVLERIEEQMADSGKGERGPSEQELEDYKQRAADELTRMRTARQTQEYDEVTRLVGKVEPWLRDRRSHLPPELFGDTWWELITCERFRQNVHRQRGQPWDGAALKRMMEELENA